MISYCKSIVTTRKKFSDFEFFDAQNSDELDNVYIAGYKENEDGSRENVRIKASAVVNMQKGVVIGDLTSAVDNPAVSVVTESLNFNSVKIIVINNTDANFIQINNIADEFYTEVDGKQYAFIRLSNNTPWGKVMKLYLPNFPINKGVMLLPTTSATIEEDEPKQIFFNKWFNDDIQENYDYFTTLLQLADPQYVSGNVIVNKTKVVECLNITSEYQAAE